MENTQNLKLKLYSGNDDFDDFYIGVAGIGSESEKSNMQKIDDFAGGIKGDVKTLIDLIGTLNTALQNRLDGVI